MQSLDDLGMAGGGSNSHPPSPLAQMLSMREAYILIDHISLQFFRFVTTLPQAVTIINFVMKFLESFPDSDIGQPELEIHPLTAEIIYHAWPVVTIQTGDLVMRGCLPRIDIFLHVVTQTTK